ncbi:hypothetical protein KNV05_gp122 [Vibrio phage River4]|uniref:Uncharacterized protein n=1 Tax=Vibrio phage River4 TaxID=2736288 RepID=A0A6M9Z0U6_9CAUD|nr:hypothetical protein KNV05_gp122 [Vibrio phage River4]QKN84833.1 hypothetical protein RIVER4_194 [Vibrio phage River4]
MKNLCDNLRDLTTKSINDLEIVLARCEKENPVIIKLLNLPSQVLYNLTKTYKNNLNSVWGLVHSLRHAFVDDGDWSIVRKVNKDILEMRARLGLDTENDIPYTYSIEPGDWTMDDGVEAIILLEEDWDALIDTYMLHINYYNDNREAVDNHSEVENKKYWELLRKSDELYESWFKERLN